VIQKNIQVLVHGDQEMVEDRYQHLQVLILGWIVMLNQI
jgi:hypothetical protein